jgi:hypothetical protein
MLSRYLFRFTLSIAVLLLTAWLLLPLYLRPVLEDALSNSLQQPVRIGHVQWDLSTGLLQVSDLDIAQQAITWRDLQLFIHWPALRHHVLDVALIRLQSPQMSLIRDQTGVRLAGLPAMSASNEEETGASPWRVNIREVDVQYAQLQWQDGRNQASAYMYWLHAKQDDASHYTVQTHTVFDAAMTDQGLPQAALTLKVKGVLALQDSVAIPNFTGRVVVEDSHADVASMQLAAQQLSWDGYSTVTAQSIAVHGNWQLHQLDVDAAPQAIHLDAVQWQGRVTWPLEEHGKATLDGQWHTKPLHVVLDAYTTLDVAHSDWQGHARLTVPAMDAEIDSQLQLTGLHLSGQNKLAVQGDDIHWQGVVKQQGATTSLDGRWRLQQFRGIAEAQPWSLREGQWQGSMQLKQGKTGVQLQVKQQLQMHDVQAESWLAMKSLQWDGAWDVQQATTKPTNFHSKQHHITVDGFSLSPSANNSSGVEHATWQGDLAMHICQQGGRANCEHQLTTSGDIKAAQLQLTLPEAGRLDLAHATWQGSVNASAGQDVTQGKMKSTIKLQALRFEDEKQHLGLADMAWQGALQASDDGKTRQVTGQGAMQAGSLHWYDGEAETQLAKVLAKGLKLTLRDHTKQQLSAQLARLSLSSLHWPSATWGHDGALTLAQAEGKQLSITMERDKQRTTGFVGLDALRLSGIDAAWQRVAAAPKPSDDDAQQPANPKPVQADAGTSETSDWQWRLGAFKLDGDNHFAIRDDAITPAWHSSLSDIYGELGALDSRHGDVATPFNLAAKLAPAGQLQLQGKLFLHDAKQGALVVQSTASLNNVDAAPLSGYVESVSGYALQRGTVYAGLDAHVVGQTLKSTLNLRLDHLKVTAQTPTVVDTLQNFIGLSPEAALDTLRDSNDSIKLDIPIDGDLAAPDFKLKYVVQKALGGSLQKGALAYLKYAFQPYGAMLGAAMWVGKEMHTIRLPSIPVALGEVEATSQARDDILAKAAAVLQRTPTAALAVCGQAVAADYYAQVERQNQQQPLQAETQETTLRSLAKQRAEAIIHLLQQRWHVPAQQLQRCRPEIIHEKMPYIKLLL